MYAKNPCFLERDPFSEEFTWLADRFGVSGQLNLAQNQK